MSFLHNLTLGKKITLLTALGLLLGVGVFSTLGMHAVGQASGRMLQDRLTTARLVADYVDEALARAQLTLQNAAAGIGGNLGPDNIAAQIATLERDYERSSVNLYGVYLIDGTGHPLWSRAGSPPVNGDLWDYASVKQAASSGQPTISGLVSAPVTNVPVVLIASPTLPDGGAVLVAAVNLGASSIGGFVRPIQLGQTGYVELVDQNGVVVTRTEPGPTLAPFEKSDHSARFAALIAAGEPTQGVCHTCHEASQKIERQDVLAFVPLSTTSWGVVIRQSEAEALGPAAELRRNLIIFGAGLVTVALLFVVVTTRDVGSRITTLTAASRRIAEGDLTSPVSRLGRDEVGVLAITLDDMRLKLKTSYDDLEQKTRELSSLLSVSEILTSALDLPSLLNSVLARTVEVVPGADGGALFLASAGNEGPLVYTASKAGRGDPMAGLLGTVSGAPQFDTLAFSDAWRARVKSHAFAEISHRGRNAGSMIMINTSSTHAFTDSDQRLLQGIADYIAVAIERAQLTRQAEEAGALREADRLRSQFISSVSHELRSPLTLIKGYSTSLLRQDVAWDRPTEQEFLRVIDEKTDVLRDLIDKLLQSAKLEAGALKLVKEPVLIPQLAHKAVDDAELKAKGHRFTVDFPPSFPVVEADLRCLEQVLHNLLQNAVKYSPAGSEIVVRGETNDGSVVVSVADQGIGISTEHQDKVFGRFYRVDDPLVRSTGGSGLGLSIIKGHIEAHGGRVWLESEPGQGSRFYFSLPIEPDDAGEKEAHSP